MADTSVLASVRSILESPILDAHKWAKVPSIPVDAVLLDLEDSVPPERKEEARARVVSQLGALDYFGGKIPIPRPNGLDTPWGEADVRALAKKRPEVIAYPKVRTADELRVLRSLFHAEGADPGIVVIVETARAVLELEAIAQVEGVVGLLLGPSDLSVDAGWTLFADGAPFLEPYHFARSKLSLVGAAYALPVWDTVFVPDLRDPDQVRAATVRAKRFGLSGMATFYPPHVEIIHEVFSPSDEEVEAAREVVSTYEKAVASGSAAVKVGGRALIVQDYKRAKRTLERARRR